jgi:hypothetical protein
VKNHKIADNSTTTKAREKISTDLELKHLSVIFDKQQKFGLLKIYSFEQILFNIKLLLWALISLMC